MALAEDLRLRPDRRLYLKESYAFKNPADFDNLRKAGLPE